MLSINQMWICTGLNTLSPYNKESKSSCNLCYGIFSFKVLVPGRSGRGQSPRLESRSRATRVLAEVTRAREAIVFKMRLPTGQWRTWSRSRGRLEAGSKCSGKVRKRDQVVEEIFLENVDGWRQRRKQKEGSEMRKLSLAESDHCAVLKINQPLPPPPRSSSSCLLWSLWARD